MRTVRMDNTILNLTLDVDGQLLRYSHGPQAVQIMTGRGRAGRTSAYAARSGQWQHRNAGDQRFPALNRFFDKARTSHGAGSLSRQATFNVDGHQVTLEFAPNSIRNPFQLPRFSCP